MCGHTLTGNLVYNNKIWSITPTSYVKDLIETERGMIDDIFHMIRPDFGLILT